jgi:ADP-L-glycero-D-manno-heptose 6-epimerase
MPLMNASRLTEPVIVVTGAAGFIGSGVVRHLNDQGCTALLLVDDLKKSQKWKNLVRKRCVDLISKHALMEWLQGRQEQVRAFIHLGACSDTLEADGDYLMENNYRYTVRLAEYALTHGKRLIYASSAATYGDGALGFSDDHERLDQLKPLNLYGYSKHLFDLWAKEQGVLDQIVGLKYFNIFGPNENHKGRMASMVFNKLPEAQQKGVVRLFKSSEPERFADGGQCRDFLYVKDAVKMTCGFLHTNASGIFNIGRGQPTTWNALASALFKALEVPGRIEYFDMPADLVGQYQNYTCADMNKYLCAHGSDPFSFTVEEGVIDYVRNYLVKDERW